jgi:hypothetical protein
VHWTGIPAAIVDNVRVGAEEARRIRVGLSLMKCTGQGAHDDRGAPTMNATISLSSHWSISVFRGMAIMVQLKVAVKMS